MNNLLGFFPSKRWWFGLVGLVLLAAGCAPAAASTSEASTPIVVLTPTVEQAVQSSATAEGAIEATGVLKDTPTAVNRSTPTMALETPTKAELAPGEWKKLPVIPVVSARAREIYQRGLEMGNDSGAFSKVGDCESRTTWYLWDYDQKHKNYSLGEHTELEDIITEYGGSYGRLSLAAKPGFTAASLLSPLWADKELCQKNENPLACEYRIHRPAIALVTLGTNDANRPETFERNLRKLVEYSIEMGVLPVLATKADNLEKDESINAVIATVAHEYELPLWNYWLAVQGLPGNGLQDDGAHLTWAPNHFDDPHAMKAAWPVRNLTALQVLQAVRAGVEE